MELKPLDILVFRGRWYNPMTAVIYTRTSTTWTHTAIYVGDGMIVEAVAKGVMKRELSHYGDRSRKVMRYMAVITPEQVEDAKIWLDEVIVTSLGYDFVSLIGYMTGIKAFNNPNRWACSELPAYMFDAIGLGLFTEMPSFIYPAVYVQLNEFQEVF